MFLEAFGIAFKVCRDLKFSHPDRKVLCKCQNDSNLLFEVKIASVMFLRYGLEKDGSVCYLKSPLM